MNVNQLSLIVLICGIRPALAFGQPLADHHQHLFSPTITAASELQPIGAAQLIQYLDEAGINMAAVLSLGYWLGNPNRPAVDNEYEQVKEENNWTSEQIAPFDNRLRGFCSFNPLKDYALAELERCAGDANLHFGIKLHFGNSDVDLENRQHVAQLQRIFDAANRHGMAIVVHMRSSVTMNRPYGAPQARIFLEEILSAAPDVPVQIAHLAGAGGYDDPSIDEAISIFAEAVARDDPKVSQLYFDVSGIAGFGDWEEKAALVARRLRELGLNRILFGSDGAIPGNHPDESWESFTQLPLSVADLMTIRNNLAPYLQ